ncbi:MAG: polysaccharide biosynthesis tyrosine autokinase [Acidipropionibacterium acidipropionici]|nr:polysaccharide biosynthesis tyrosine autokinase [Acidipropionibacterium acidipropionici]
MTPDAYEWTLARIWGALKKLWGVIVAMVLIGAVGAFAYASTLVPQFESASTLAFSAGQGSTSQELADGSTYVQTQMPTYAQLATSSAVLQPVIDDLDLVMSVQTLKESVQVTIPEHTLVLQIQVTSMSRDSAAAIANGIAQSLTRVIRQVAPKPAKGEGTAINVSLVDKAVAPNRPSSPNRLKDTMVGGGAGLVIGVFIVLVWTLLDTRIPSVQILKQLVDAPVLGAVSRTRAKGRLWTADDPSGQTAEEFRRVASALNYATFDKQTRSIIVTSAGPGEGKSAVSANLALTLAALGNRVLLIDADLRLPRVAATFDLVDVVGLTTVLVGNAPLHQATQQPVGNELDVLASGALPPNPAEFLTSERMHTLLTDAAGHYDFVIIDSPPVLSVADAGLLVPITDGALIVVDAKHTTRAALASAISSLEDAGGQIAGVVLNRARADADGAASYGQYLAPKRTSRRAKPGSDVTRVSPQAADQRSPRTARRGQ